MPTALCIHGHFYQPPREDPWLGDILVEASAAPVLNWNERILRESYAPLSFARRLDAAGNISDLMNCYEWINFNAGPTLLRWMRRAAPETVRRMREGDANSLARWSHGNAMAQIYHHIIMPLATATDRAVETRWAIDDFRFHFGRDPEGMWLSECAVDLPSLEALAAAGITYVILAPRQAKAIIREGAHLPVNENSLDCGEPYKIRLPSGKSICAVFYNGKLSQSIAFEGLLRNGEDFWRRISAEASSLPTPPGRDISLLTLATDGETYGHHSVFGEMALAYVLAQGYAGRDEIRLTNLGAHIAANPPHLEVEIHEPSSWSCVHGVDRWMRDCGCTDGGHGGWNQKWRGPLREALNIMRSRICEHFQKAGENCFTDPQAALMDYGRVLADPEKSEDFASVWFNHKGKQSDLAFKLLDMQEQSLAAFASCAWFFDDIARIEPENAMTFALRAMDLMRESHGPDIRGEVLDILEKALSNQSGAGTGRQVFEREVLPRRPDPAGLCLLALALSTADGAIPEPGTLIRRNWPRMSVDLSLEKSWGGVMRGTALIRFGCEKQGTVYAWRMENAALNPESTKDFLPLAEACLKAWPADKPSGEQWSRCIKDFARPLLDWLQTLRLTDLQEKQKKSLLPLAAHAASLILPWEEWQHGLPHPELWAALAPYLALEYMKSDKIEDSKREQLGKILSLLLTDNLRELAALLLRREILIGLDENGGERTIDDSCLAQWAQRTRLIIPDMDWWEVQNKIWTLGIGSYPQSARELHFCR
ncbi:MAG: DUF3536 domain-containing protein [Desulfovibrio sp.]|jgi:alpha-amylase/alpha-mannosidase (GH57 family)|nr:DUF3536 domain-containing protein [Desulfovibrio sp.]